MLWSARAEAYRAGDRATMERGEPILNQEEISRDENGAEMVILDQQGPAAQQLRRGGRPARHDRLT